MPGDLIAEVVEGLARERPDLDRRTVETVCRLILMGRVMEDFAARTLEPFGLNYTDLDVLATLRRTPQPHELTPAELMGPVMISSGAMSVSLDRLEEQDLIRRRVSEEDRRSRIVSLTEKGRALIDEALTVRWSEAERLIQPLTIWEVEGVNAVLRKIELAAAG